MARPDLAPYLVHLRALPFVRAAEERTAAAISRAGNARGLKKNWIRIATPKGKFELLVQRQHSFLDRASLAALATDLGGRRVLLVARYVPQPSAQTLAAARVNFVDLYGNLHLDLGARYQGFVIGKGRTDRHQDTSFLKRTDAQVLLALLTDAEAVQASARRLGELAGVGKSAADGVRHRLVRAGILAAARAAADAKRRKRYRIIDRPRLEERAAEAYRHALRPPLLLERFRMAEPESSKSLSRITDELRAAQASAGGTWALTGAAAAYQVQHFYLGPQIAAFVTPDLARSARGRGWTPDPDGPVHLLGMPTMPVVWKNAGLVPMAQPWLIYCELLYEGTPRAIEAAELFKDEFLQSK